LDTLRDLNGQGFRDYEIIVVDQSDDRNAAAEQFLKKCKVPSRYVFVSNFRGLPEARNLGWRIASHDIVLYTDDDIQCGPNFLQAHFDAHIASGAAMVAGGITEAKGDMTRSGQTGSFNWWTASTITNFHLNQPGYCLHAKGCNFSVRRKVLELVGGFDENLTLGAALYEETEIALRLKQAGYSCWFAPKAHLTHLASPMGGCRVGPNVQRYMFGMGHNRAILIFRHLKPWHRPTALLRMVAFGLSYSRKERSVSPLVSALCGIVAGRKAAFRVKAETQCP
jgi:GT2 family glycosyltransferase